MKSISNSIALASISLLFSNTATSNEGLPESFSEYGWLLEGAREVVRRNTEFAPVTTCFDLNRMFTGETTSSIQKERAWEDYEGKLIPLTGIVEEVKRIPITNDYMAFFKCTNSESFIVDFTVEIPKEMEEYAFELTPGERRDMYVRLTDYGEMMGVSTELDTFEVERSSGETCFAYLRMMSRSPDEYEYKCYETEEKTGFGNLTIEPEVSQIASLLKTGDRTIMFFTYPENPDSYRSIINSDEGATFYFSDNENNCELTESYLRENQDWTKSTFERLKSDLFKVNGHTNLNEWYINRQQYVTSLNDEPYTCEQKQTLRMMIFLGYEKASEAGGLQNVPGFISQQIKD